MSVVNHENSRRPIFSSLFLKFLWRLFFKLIGIILFLIGIIILLIMLSYDTNDPSFRSSEGNSVNNILGSFGSHIADPLHLSLGITHLVIILILGIWSWRLFFDVNKERILGRLFFIPIPISTSSIFFSTYPPSDKWEFSYGLGGIFGDTVLIFILENTSFGQNETLRVTSLIFGILSLFFICSISAITKREFYSVLKILLFSVFDGIKTIFRIRKLISLPKEILKLNFYDNKKSAIGVKVEPSFSNQKII